MASIKEVAHAFFVACETGKGWDACKGYCKPDATFSSQAGAVADVCTLQQYADWMKGLLVILPDAKYAVKSFAVDEERKNVCAYGSSPARIRARAGRARQRARRSTSRTTSM